MRKMKRSCIKVQNMSIWRFDSLDRRLKMSSANVRLILHRVAQPSPDPRALMQFWQKAIMLLDGMKST